MSTVSAYAASDSTGHLSKTTITRRDPGPHDVAIDIKFAGICHSDIHTVKSEWGVPSYPIVPGHEIAGVVTAVGTEVTKHKVGDHVGVGCMVNSCGHCSSCSAGLEQYCKNGATFTYNAIDKDGTPTQGGYSQAVVVNENFVVRIPDSLPLDKAAPQAGDHRLGRTRARGRQARCRVGGRRDCALAVAEEDGGRTSPGRQQLL